MLNLSVSGKSGLACSSRAARTISRRASGDALHLAIAAHPERFQPITAALAGRLQELITV